MLWVNCILFWFNMISCWAYFRPERFRVCWAWNKFDIFQLLSLFFMLNEHIFFMQVPVVLQTDRLISRPVVTLLSKTDVKFQWEPVLDAQFYTFFWCRGASTYEKECLVCITHFHCFTFLKFITRASWMHYPMTHQQLYCAIQDAQPILHCILYAQIQHNV